ncbi:MAG TPA: glycosyltransferase family 4 protein [Bacteroidia bacterium]|nr:glycosyltransferase family 4 protein [Bacteroidia bacterium]
MSKNIAIIFPRKSGSPETFIQAHINHLPCNKTILHDGRFPKVIEGGISLSSYSGESLIERMYHSFNARLFGKMHNPDMEKALLNFFIKNKIDAVLAEYGFTGSEVGSVCKKAGIPLIVHFHGYDAYMNSVLLEYKEKYKIMFQSAAAIIAVSNDMKQQLISLGAPPEKVFYNPYGVDLNFFKAKEKSSGTHVFLFTGRFVNKKAPHLLLIAFNRVLKEIPNAKLIMIGDGGVVGSDQLFNACKQLVAALKINHAVEFYGAKSHESVANAMQNATIYVQHSVVPENGDSEGTPVAILEASASGLPVISTKHAGIKDVIIDGETGYLVDEYDVDAMTERMIHLANNPELAYSMGQAARIRIAEYFPMEKSIDNLWKIIRSTISE